jgi:glycosyltransferase involved in cell wall biosynthesis
MVTTFYPPYNFGGDGVFVYRLANALAHRGHEVHIIHDRDAFTLLSKNPPTAIYNHPNITLHSLSKGNLGSLDLVLTHQLGRPVSKREQIKAILANNDFDVIHFHNVSLLGGPDILRYGRATKLCTLHDHWFVCAMHILWRFDREPCTQRTCMSCTLAGHRPPQVWRYTGSIDRAVQHIDAFIAPSHFAQQSHLVNGLRVPIHYLPHFLPNTEVSISSSVTEGYQHPRPYFLFVGRLEKIKGVQVLLEQFRTYRSADLLIAGAGCYEEELKTLAKDLPHVHFLGRINHWQLRELYRQAIAVVVPSLCYETFGLVPIEAFAVGTPAIVNNLGALPEVVQLGGGGLVYRTNEELLNVMELLRTQPDLRNQLGQQGYRSFSENYTEEQHLSRYFQIIQRFQNILVAEEVLV